MPEPVTSETVPKSGTDTLQQDQHVLPDQDSATQAHVPEPVTSEIGRLVGRASPHQGHYALPGVGQIPHSELKLSTSELRDIVLIVDVDSSHLDLMKTTACGAYVIACVDPSDESRAPFRSYIPPRRYHAGRSDLPYLDHRRDSLQEARRLGSKIVSHSVGPFRGHLAAHSSDPLPFALVQSTGNDSMDSPFSADRLSLSVPTFRYNPDHKMLEFDRDITRVVKGVTLSFSAGQRLDQVAPSSPTYAARYLHAFHNIRWAVANDQVIYVAGYTLDSQGREVKHPKSNGCVGVKDACVWAPFQILVHELGYGVPGAGWPAGLVQGTSYGPPRVAMAMASMLSVYPELSPTNLVAFTKACARENARDKLKGLGIADFSCMLNIGENGVVSVKDAEDLGLSDIAALPSLPGELVVATRLVDRQGHESPFRKLVPAAPMAHRSGLALASTDSPEAFQKGLPPQFRFAIREDIDLFGIQESELPGLGFAWRRGPLFAAIGHSVRDRFFGFAGGGGAWNFRGTREIGVNLGHDNLHLRFTNQRTRSRAELEGNSLGITARKEFELRGDWRLGVLAEADQFLGGKARIPGMSGTAKIAAGKPGYRGEIRLTRSF